MERLIQMGADGIITDYPNRLRAVMAEKEIPLPPACSPLCPRKKAVTKWRRRAVWPFVPSLLVGEAAMVCPRVRMGSETAAIWK